MSIEPAWSYSALSSYELCPKRHYHLKVLKDVKESESDAVRWGKKVHRAFELRVKEPSVPLPPELMAYEPLLARFAAATGTVWAEQQIAIRKNFTQTEWFAKDVWFRVVIDLLIIKGSRALVVDYKTGRQNDIFDQLELTAAVVMTLHPEILTVVSAYLWLKDQILVKETWSRTHVPSIWRKNIARLIPFTAAHTTNHWPAKPNGLCRRYCPVALCPHNGK